ncbi:MAG: MarR family transcriptional regulator [Bacteroidota bacterium]
MKLEDEIKTSQFISQRHKLNVNLIYSYNWMISRMQAVFRSNGVTLQQYNILRILRGQYPNPSTIQLLKSRMLDKQPDASRLIDRLAAKELVTRQVSRTDRRKMDVLISEKGLELLAGMEPDIEHFNNYSSCLSEEEVQQLNDLLDKMRDFGRED